MPLRVARCLGKVLRDSARRDVINTVARSKGGRAANEKRTRTDLDSYSRRRACLADRDASASSCEAPRRAKAADGVCRDPQKRKNRPGLTQDGFNVTQDYSLKIREVVQVISYEVPSGFQHAEKTPDLPQEAQSTLQKLHTPWPSCWANLPAPNRCRFGAVGIHTTASKEVAKLLAPRMQLHRHGLRAMSRGWYSGNRYSPTPFPGCNRA